MQQRRLRLGDILDDYCPRERRLTNHAVVAMIDDEVRQTRCTTCDAEHEYKQARVPASRRRKGSDSAADLLPPVLANAPGPDAHDSPDDAGAEHTPSLFAEPQDAPQEDAPPALNAQNTEIDVPDVPDMDDEGPAELLEDEGPVHRPLIRATLPRPEGQTPERKAPDFTVRQPGGRFDQERNNQRNRGRQQTRHTSQSGQPPRGGTRQGSGRPGGDPQRQRNGNRSGNTAGSRGGGRPFGSDRGPRSGGGHGRKRGR
jgi:hypothetical protein